MTDSLSKFIFTEIFLGPSFILIAGLYRNITNIVLRRSMESDLFRAKVRATLFSLIVAAYISLIISDLISGTFATFNLIKTAGIKLILSQISCKAFLVLLIIAAIVVIESEIIPANKCAFFTCIAAAFLYMVLTYLIVQGFTARNTVFQSELIHRAYYIMFFVLFLKIRLKIWKQGI